MNKILEAFGAAVRYTERFLGPDDDWVEDDRRIAYEAAERLFGRWHTFVGEKTNEDYLLKANVHPDVIERKLANNDYQRNLASKRAYREHHDGGRQWACGAYVFDPVETEWQQHITLFKTQDNNSDIYSHTETSVREGYDHLTEPNYRFDDPTNRIRDILHDANIKYSQ